MRRHPFRVAFVALACLLLPACVPAPKPSPFTGFYKNFAGCRQEYADMDARVARAGVGSAEFHRVPGHPYFRTDRLLASLRTQVHGLEDVAEWTRRMRELDQEARDYEYANLGMDALEISLQRDRFLNCGRILANLDLEPPRAWTRLLDVAYPPDAYSGWARVVGLHVLQVPALRADRAAANTQLARQHAQVPVAMPARLWSAQRSDDATPLPEAGRPVQVNALGFPNLMVSQWRTLVEAQAPLLWTESAAPADQPAAPVWTADGPRADPQQPQLSYQVGYARFGGRMVVQITYTVWFAAGSQAAHTPIDGLIWRVTLDPQLEPMLYESLHASGADHRWYPVRALELRPDVDADLSFVAPGLAPARTPVLHLEAGTHRLRRVVAADGLVPMQALRFELHAYEELYTLPLPGGGSRSLFDPEGMLVGSQASGERAGWSSGIARPGLLRQAGHHAISRIGRRHFDDPDLLDATFVMPGTAVSLAAVPAR